MISKTKVILLAAVSAVVLAMQGQPKMMRLHNADGSSAVMSVPEMQKISFLAPGATGKGITMNFTSGEPVALLFSDEPTIIFADGRIRLSSSGLGSHVEAEFEDVTDLTFGELASLDTVYAGAAIVCRIAAGEVRFSGIPDGEYAGVFSVDGKSEGIYPVTSGELVLTLDMLNAGIHIVKIGTFIAKIKL